MAPYSQLVGKGRTVFQREWQGQRGRRSNAIGIAPEPGDFCAGCRHTAKPIYLTRWCGQGPRLVEQRPMTGVPPPGPDEPEDGQGDNARHYRRTGDAQDRVSRLGGTRPATLCKVKARLV